MSVVCTSMSKGKLIALWGHLAPPVKHGSLIRPKGEPSFCTVSQFIQRQNGHILIDCECGRQFTIDDIEEIRN
jgi:hypothetical protein